MSWLKRVIARLLGHTTKPLDNPVPPTQTVGLASKELTPSVGNKRSAVAKPPKSAKQKPKSSKKVVPKATQGKSAKPVQKSARKTYGQKASKTHA